MKSFITGLFAYAFKLLPKTSDTSEMVTKALLSIAEISRFIRPTWNRLTTK